ncbi:MAG: aminotransferase class I/II-fold pyridoxal phosphate-dependent enzyme [candidate division Zixibacteria bacterium]|nr:aminotransferase class I/II-fold pyridoxal phosphate-dependent enzyme [candidate division Zixibacteria bacterium]
MKTIDLRSDTVTRPSEEMRKVIANAEVGDDVLGDDPTVNRLQAVVADMFEVEASLYVPSGTMGNQVALKTISRPGWEILCERECHIVNYETGGPAIHSNLMINMLTTERGVMTAEQIENSIRPDNIHAPRTKIIEIENTHNRHGGTIYPLDEIHRIRKVADTYGLLMHLDGARIWNAHIASGISLADWVRPFDSISVCLSKGLGAPVGSMILGSKPFIEEARRNRKLFGGGMRQVGLLAAAGLYAIEHNLHRLAEDHDKARAIAEGINGVNGFAIDMVRVQTNILIIDISATGRDSLTVLEIMQRAGVLGVPFGKTRIRLVTHLDVTMEECIEAVRRIAELDFS